MLGRALGLSLSLCTVAVPRAELGFKFRQPLLDEAVQVRLVADALVVDAAAGGGKGG